MGVLCQGVLLFVLVAAPASSGAPDATPLSQVPFLSVWNAPTANCLSQYGVDLDLGTFSIVQNNNQSFIGDNMTIFYSDKLGFYPRYTSLGQAVNGGVPQNASLDRHLDAAAQTIRQWIPERVFQGLAVVDWESWRPVWERNWDTKQVYQEASRALVRARHPEWGPAEVDAAARADFQAAARSFMEETLKLGLRERPAGLWGFYGFPNCYNYYSGKGANYTGECPAVELRRNDELRWLWSASAALYPDIYLSLEMRPLGREVLLYARHRVLEAMRAAAGVPPPAPPVLPYARIVYTYTLDFLSQEHLVSTIGESAALGSAGIVLWGDHTFSKSQASCQAVKSYLDEKLGPYVVNVTAAAWMCSSAMCSSHGRCARREGRWGSYLHLDPSLWKVTWEERAWGGRRYTVAGRPAAAAAAKARQAPNQDDFECRCFPGWSGPSCSQPAPIT